MDEDVLTSPKTCENFMINKSVVSFIVLDVEKKN